ncbi:hypothetical protein [Ohtaekwangia sp.]|jgi:hypothetical protein|uniref:hypothetical protein n=1 Tax=Ohtaekwangia sp. TaxID=2066019 RepID=UPI002F937045
MRILITLLLIAIACATQAQSSKRKRKRESSSQATEQNSPTTLEPYYPKKEYGPRKSRNKKRGGGPTYESQDEYEARMRETVKTIRRNERLMMKPQYSNPMYFGHKRPPKKRPPNKMKYCKVCGIRH